MSAERNVYSAERIAALSRAAHEARRSNGATGGALEGAVQKALGAVPPEKRGTVAGDVAALLAVGERREAAVAPTLGGDAPKGAVQELMQKRAALELQLKTEIGKREDVEAALAREKEDHQQAIESLSLQQRQIRELQEERSKLLKNLSETDARLRLQTNETEQANLRYEKLKAGRQAMGDQAVGLAETINTLKSENETLRAEVEKAKNERDHLVAAAKDEVVVAEGNTAEAAFERLWARMREKMPDLFVETHHATERTFEQVCDALVEYITTFALLESHVQYMLQQLRGVGEGGDKLNHFFLMFKKNPGTIDLLRETLVTGRRASQHVNLVRALQAWSRAFCTGPYKAIVVSPSNMSERLNYRNWGIKLGWGEEAAIGKHFKEVAQRQIPDALGTELKRLAADMAYEDYNNLMKRR